MQVKLWRYLSFLIHNNKIFRTYYINDLFFNQPGVIHDTSLTFWVYLSQRTLLGVFSAASLMMFEGAVMATIQETGGDYGIQR